MLRPCLVAIAMLFAAHAQAEPVALARDIHLIPEQKMPGREPDGNSTLIETPRGLILIDTGRHKAHQEAILAFARARNKPIIAMFNTHWHLDHSGGNAEIRAAFPKVPLYASTAIDGALRGFLSKSRAEAEAYLQSGKATPETRDDIALDIAAMDDPAALRPDKPVNEDTPLRIGGRALDIHLARFAATEGDVWLVDRKTGVLVAGDLVVSIVPYFDTACAEGWRRALDNIAATDFRILVPGHGSPMTKTQFLDWRHAFDALLDCAASKASNETCIAGWRRDAAAFIPTGTRLLDGMLPYYLDTRLRPAEPERLRYCRPQ